MQTVFGMNVRNFDDGTNIKGTIAHYLETAIPLTAVTIWIIVASQTNAPGANRHSRGWQRLAWPIYLTKRMLLFWRTKRRVDSDDDSDDDVVKPSNMIY
jgi:hypothetical protein